MRLDLDFCQIQADLEESFLGKQNWVAKWQELSQRVVAMRPHPAWTVPEDPTWEEDPFNQKNWRTQYHMLRWLDPARVQALRGDPEARRFLSHYMRSWIEACPPKRYVGPKDYAWGDMVDGTRAIRLVAAAAVLEPGAREWLMCSIGEHRDWLKDEQNLGHSNHALVQHEGLFVTAQALGDSDSVELALGQLAQLFHSQYDEDGINAEGALGYHLLNLKIWLRVARRLEASGYQMYNMPPDLEQMVRDEMAFATRPDGRIEQIGDTNFGRTHFRAAPFDYIYSKGAIGSPPKGLSRFYQDGYAFGRSGWGEFERNFEEEAFYTALFGRVNKVHGHADAGAVTFYADGQSWLVDSGKYGYFTGDPYQRYFLSRAAHNVTVFGEYRGKVPARGELLASGSTHDDIRITDSNHGDGVVTRRLIFVRSGEFLVVVDEAVGAEKTTFDNLWHFHPDCTTTAHPGGRFEALAGGRSCQLMTVPAPISSQIIREQKSPIQGWYSERWGEKVAADVISTTHEANRPVVTVVGPGVDNASVEVESRSSGMQIEVTKGRRLFTIELTPTGSRVVVQHGVEKSSRQDEWEWPFNQRRVTAMLERWGDRSDLAIASAVRTTAAQKNSTVHSIPTLLKALTSRMSTEDEGVSSACLADVAAMMGAGPGDHVYGKRVPEWRLPILSAEEVRVSPKGGEIQQFDDPLTVMKMATQEPNKPVYGAVRKGGLVMPFMLRGGSGNTLIVRLHGALNRGKITLPMLEGGTTESTQARPFLILQDPSLDLSASVKLTWYLGAPRTDAHEWMSEVIGEIRRSLGLSKALIQGSSGGGFAAMQVASRLEDSVAVAFNPQTDIRNYHATQIADAIRLCLGHAVEDVGGHQPRLSVSDRLRDGGRLSLLYVNNKGDSFHLKRHFQDFIKRTDLSKVNLSVETVDLGPGHVAPTPGVQQQFRLRALQLLGDAD